MEPGFPTHQIDPSDEAEAEMIAERDYKMGGNPEYDEFDRSGIDTIRAEVSGYGTYS
jgi:hypothetical protein